MSDVRHNGEEYRWASSLLEEVEDEVREPEKAITEVVRRALGNLRTVEKAHGWQVVDDVRLAAEGAWMRIHTGPWHLVQDATRDLHGLATFLEDMLLAPLTGSVGREQQEERLRRLDMGVMLSGPRTREKLKARAGQLHEQLVANEAIEGNIVKDASLHVDESQLPPSTWKGTPAERIHREEGFDGFIHNLVRGFKPLLLEDLARSWPCTEKWNDTAHLKRLCGFRTVPVEVGRHYASDEYRQEMMTIAEFLDGPFWSDGVDASERRYLAQHQLLDQCPELWREVATPDEVTALGELQAANAWIGPKGTVTPPHTDRHHNVFVQVVGMKYVRLWRPESASALYPHEGSLLGNTSSVDVHCPDQEAFPGFSHEPFYEALLTGGDALFIPRQWWHFVQSLSPSVSLSFWAS